MARSPRRISFSRTMSGSVEADHHVGGLDDGIGLLAHLEAKLVDRLVGDRGGDDRAAHVDADMRGRGALLHVDDLALETVSRTDPHGRCPLVIFRGLYRPVQRIAPSHGTISCARAR